MTTPSPGKKKKLKRVVCSCGGTPKLSEERPCFVYCNKCGKETHVWVYAREAWKQFSLIAEIIE